MVNTDQIEENLEVVGSDGEHLGRVERMEGNERIKLAESDSNSFGHAHFIPFGWVSSVEGGQVKLSRSALEAEDYWEHEGGESAAEAVSGSGKSYRKVAPEND